MTDPTERILFGTGSPNVRKVGLLLEELGLDYAMKHVAVFSGEQFEPDFLAMNPIAKVPVLTDPGADEPLFESNAILIYLAETYGPDFLPEAGAARRDVMRWLMVQTALVGPMTFLGLIAASLAREVVPESRHALLLPAAAVTGAIILVAGQFLFERLMGQQSALGVIVEFLGGLLFLALVLGRRRL